MSGMRPLDPSQLSHPSSSSVPPCFFFLVVVFYFFGGWSSYTRPPLFYFDESPSLPFYFSINNCADRSEPPRPRVAFFFSPVVASSVQTPGRAPAITAPLFSALSSLRKFPAHVNPTPTCPRILDGRTRPSPSFFLRPFSSHSILFSLPAQSPFSLFTRTVFLMIFFSLFNSF